MKTYKQTNQNEIQCVFATDNNYVAYLSVAIISLIRKASKQDKYTIYVLEETLINKYKKKLETLSTENVKIKFVNVKEVFSRYPKEIFYTHGHFTKATYYRFFINELFPNINKIIYLDCDIIINSDIKDLYNINSSYISAVPTGIYKKPEELNYIKSLNIQDIYKYFNAGVLVFDLQKLKDFDFTNKCIEILNTHKNLELLDQDVLNILFNNNVQLIDCEWNVFNHLLFKEYKKSHVTEENKKHYKKLELVSKNPKIIHYTSNVKPWNDPFIKNSIYFWKNALLSPFINEIVVKMIKYIVNELCKELIKSLEFMFSTKIESSHIIIKILGIKISIRRTL